jgi:hypothetical protein
MKPNRMPRGGPLLLAVIGLNMSIGPAASAAPTPALSLAGSWRFQIDRQDVGKHEGWFKSLLSDRIKLPGAMAESGKGDDVTLETKWTGGIVDKSWFTAPEMAKYREPGNVKVPFWLQPEKSYVGAAWYQRDIEVPKDWQGQRVVLSLERPHWETQVWFDDRFVGSNNSLSTPHEYDLGVVEQASSLSSSNRQDARSTTQFTPGQHTLTIRVDNRLVVDVGHDSHSVSDHTQGNWNGIAGRMELRTTPPVWIEDLQVYPRDVTLRPARVTVRGRLGNATGQPGQGKLWLHADYAALMSSAAADRAIDVSWDATGGTFETELSFDERVRLWDEFDPVTYKLAAFLHRSDRAQTDPDEAIRPDCEVTFGLREFAADGTQFTINGRKTFIRGTLDCCIYPKTGYPPTDVAEWKRILGVAKGHGLNNLRFHSWCPPEAAFIAADELGMYLHVEASSWANSSTTLGDGKPVDRWLYEETDRILKTYGNHPSFALMAYGNEPGGKAHAAFLAKWVDSCKAKDPRRLYTSGAGWPQIPQNQWHSVPDPRVQAWGGGLKSRINARPPETTTDYRDYIAARKVPIVSHEIGQWCVYPNFDEIKKYTGYLKARNFEIFRDTLKAHGMLDQAHDFLLASGKLQALCYKEDIESALRTPGMGGFQLLDLHDFPGQGTALVGVLDPFWEEKGYVTPKEYSRFCNSTVPLARLSKRVFTTDEVLTAELEVAHFGAAPLKNVAPTFRLIGDHGQVHFQGQLTPQDVPVGNVRLSPLNLDLRGLPAPARYRLAIGLSGTPWENDWDLWVYPPKVDSAVPSGVTVVNDLTDAGLRALNEGAKMLLMIPPERVKGDPKLGKIALGFSSIFWNTAWTARQAPHTLGILCDPRHPALAEFPTESHSNWQWWYLVSRAGAMILDGLPAKLRPTVQVIDDWFTARKLGLVFEAKLGQGKLLVTSIDLSSGVETNLVARQMRAGLLHYLASDRFKPKIEVTADQIRGLMAAPSAMQERGARIASASSAESGHEAALAIDGDAKTLWHSAWTGGEQAFPHELVLEFAQPFPIQGLTVLPRQDGNRNGWIKDYEVYVSADGHSWGEPAGQGAFGADEGLKTVTFAMPVTGRFLRFVARSGQTTGPWASVAELEVQEGR